MKRIISVLLFTALLAMQSNPLTASTDDKRPNSPKQRTCSIEEVKAFKLKQILSVLKLSEEERVPFEEVYDAYRKEIHGRVKKTPGGRDSKNLSDEALLANMRTNYSNISIVSEIKVKYIAEFSKILTARQIHQLYKTEGDFSHRMRGAADSRKKCDGLGKKRATQGRNRKGADRECWKSPRIE